MCKSDIIEYKEFVRLLCCYAAQADRIAKIMSSGGYVPPEFVSYTLSKIKSYRGYTLQVMNRMGIKDGITFMEDNEFLGFSIKNGTLSITGNRIEVSRICHKWIFGFPDTANWYQYGAAMYCVCLAYADRADLKSLYPAWLLKKTVTPAAEKAAGTA